MHTSAPTLSPGSFWPLYSSSAAFTGTLERCSGMHACRLLDGNMWRPHLPHMLGGTRRARTI
eukprot:364231-Chlamydomonas_euryale.AAC.5